MSFFEQNFLNEVQFNPIIEYAACLFTKSVKTSSTKWPSSSLKYNTSPLRHFAGDNPILLVTRRKNLLPICNFWARASKFITPSRVHIDAPERAYTEPVDYSYEDAKLILTMTASYINWTTDQARG